MINQIEFYKEQHKILGRSLVSCFIADEKIAEDYHFLTGRKNLEPEDMQILSEMFNVSFIEIENPNK